MDSRDHDPQTHFRENNPMHSRNGCRGNGGVTAGKVLESRYEFPSLVIPGRRAATSPESIVSQSLRLDGFRARAKGRAPE
ncbi:hypothetical protein ABIA95_001860 [Bradyrhizobium sp. LA8.1]